VDCALPETSKVNSLEVRDLTITYRPERSDPIRALDGVSLEIKAGEVLGILGESGCGKSTLATVLVRLLPPGAKIDGSISLAGRNILALSESELRGIRGREISLIAQDPALALNPVMTAGVQIGEVLRAHLSLNTQQRRERVMELLREVGFDHPQEIYSAYPHQLSGGQRQRVAIAQAVACRPAFLIADEPTSKLDATLQAGIIALLKQIRQQHGSAILLISHDPSLFAGFADRLAVMYAGRIVEIGSSAGVFRQPLHPYSQALLRIAASSVITDTKMTGRFPAIEGESVSADCVSGGCRFAPRCPDCMDICLHKYPGAFLPEPSRPVNCFKYGE
jgi:oligopeptide/dipeptide ABC transporter ATP-binding protein